MTQANSEVLRDLELLLRSHFGVVHLDTEEEDRAEGLLRHLADQLHIPFFTWTRSRGLLRDDLTDPIYGSREALAALQHVTHARTDAIYHFKALVGDLAPGSHLTAQLQDAGENLRDRRGCLVITGADPLPPAVARKAATLSLPEPGTEEYADLLLHIVRDLRTRGHVEITLSGEELDRLLHHLSGLTLMEAEKVLTKAIIEDGLLSVDDIEHVIEAKKVIVEREGLLEYYPVEESMAGIADLTTLKAWLAKRRDVVRSPAKAREFGLDFPKGVLLLGVPGCGKSLSAKAVASEWRLPLLKLDPSTLYNKYIGETEKNFQRAVRAAERMAPVVLWIDELEKAFATGGAEDGGVSTRVLGTFLSWMQERRGDVFVVATANDIKGLPPEFLRKGRFDEIFFVDLPDAATRSEIFEIHLTRRGQELESFDLVALSERSAGFSGSEIEEVVVAGLYTAFAAESKLLQTTLVEEVLKTRPLSVTMAEHVAEMRAWAEGRTVRAN